jgi:hypothetical protein
MLTYQEVITELADNMYHKYMGGSNNYYQIPEADIISKIYKKGYREVYDDIEILFKLKCGENKNVLA